MDVPIIFRNLIKVIRVINNLKKNHLIGDYAIGGAVAEIYYTEAKETKDLDIFTTFLPTSPGGTIITLEPIDDYLKRKGYKRRGMFIIIKSIPVDIIPANKGLECEAVKNSVEITIQGTRVRFFKAEYLTAIALKTGRYKDLSRVENLLEHKKINKKLLKKILLKHKLLTKWKKFFK